MVASFRKWLPLLGNVTLWMFCVTFWMFCVTLWIFVWYFECFVWHFECFVWHFECFVWHFECFMWHFEYLWSNCEYFVWHFECLCVTLNVLYTVHFKCFVWHALWMFCVSQMELEDWCCVRETSTYMYIVRVFFVCSQFVFTLHAYAKMTKCILNGRINQNLRKIYS